MAKDLETVGPIFKDFIETFVLKDKQGRFLQFFEKEKNWWKLKLEFHTSVHLDNKVLVEIEPSNQYADSIYLKMKKMGASDDCISLLDYLDNKGYRYSLKEKLDDTVGFLCETILYCPESKIAYFEGGHAKDRYILSSH